MADQLSEHTPEMVDSVSDAAIESGELSTPTMLKEESGTLTEPAGAPEEIPNTIRKKVNNNRVSSPARKRVATTPEERENENHAESSGADPTTPQPKKPATRQRKKAVELVGTGSETENTSVEPKKPTRSRQTQVESTSAATTSEAGSEPKKATRRRTKPVEPPALTTETTETPANEAPVSGEAISETTVPVEIASEVAPAQAEPATSVAPLSSLEEHVPHVEPAGANEPVANEALVSSTEQLVADEEPPVAAHTGEHVLVIETTSVGEESLPTQVALIEEEPVVTEGETASPPTIERRHLVKSAALVSIGNFGSSTIGMLRQVVVGSLGASIAGPFIAALAPANNFYQLLVNGAVSGALIPTFNDYSAEEKRNDLHRIVFTLVNLVLLVTILASIGYALIAPSFINVLLPGFHHNEQMLALQYSQIIFFSLIALGPFSILLAALYALKEFGWPAFATAAYHIGIILGAISVSFFGSHFIGPMALPLGVLVGSLGEIALLLPGMRNQKLRYMFVLDLKHPAIRQIAKLYLPVFLGFIFTTVAVLLDLRLQSLTHNGALTTAAMGFATTLIQFPVGLVAAALSFAVLPTLSEHVRAGNDERFKQTLLLGFRVGLLLMIPAMVGLLALRTPITYLLFAHAKFGTSGANFTALALQNYAYQLPFVVLDQLLIFAFYARKNTKTPVVIGVVCIAFYLMVALPFYSNIGMPALAFANTVQNSMHAIILLILLRKAIGALNIRSTLPAILKICGAAALMGLAIWFSLAVLGQFSLFSLNHFIGQFLTVIVAGILAVAVYVGAILALKVEEINLVKGAILAKLGRR